MVKRSSFFDVLSKIGSILPVAIETAEVGAALLAPGQSNGAAKAAAVTQVVLGALQGYTAATGDSLAEHPEVQANVAALITGAVGLRNIVVGKGAPAAPAPDTGPPIDVAGAGVAAAAAVPLPTSPAPAGAQS